MVTVALLALACGRTGPFRSADGGLAGFAADPAVRTIAQGRLQ
jgi:hypothetical protein